ncbi:MAG TPA: efflux RND transporter permease subunit [Planctomycetota bacterium]|nr:efflux RND transporter permease subunit [Planctomycetota bacterium]
MLSALVRFSLRHRGVVVVLAAALLSFGAYVVAHAKLDVFPDFAPPEVTVQTEAPGLSAEQVELLVTRPVEAALNGAGRLDALRSQSIQGLSIVTAIFRSGTDVHLARQVLAEQLVEAAGQLPAGVQPPKLTPLTSATMDLLKIGLLSEKLTPMELRSFAQWTLRPRLLAVQGVANVSVFGGELRQLQIRLRSDRLRAFDFSIQEVADAAQAATGVRGAGFVDTGNQRIVIQSEGQFSTPAALAQIVLARRGDRNVLLSDVADVVEAPEPKFGEALIQGKPGVLLTMLSQYGANTMDTTRGVEAALAEMKPAIEAQGIVLLDRLHRPATFIENAISNLRSSLLLGAVLVAVVLFLFLYNLRTAAISLAAIPLSLVGAVVVLHFFGATLNTITLGGLAIALGEVVDDAIIDVENIFRRLRENRALAQPRPSFQVVFDASLEVRRTVVYAAFIVGFVFLPVLTMSGLQGRLFAPLGQAYLLAVFVSLLVALTVTPALALILLPKAAEKTSELPLLARARSGYRRVLGTFTGRPWLVIVPAILVCVAALALLPFFGGEWLPAFREGHFVLQASGAPGTSLEEMKRIGARISTDLLAIPAVATVSQQIGRAERGEDPWGPHRSEFHLELKDVPAKEQPRIESEIRGVMQSYPGLHTNVLTFLGDRIGETITGETASVVVGVYGDDLEVLDTKAREIVSALSSVKGAVDVQQGSMPGLPQMQVELEADRLARFGFRPVEVLDAVQTAFQGRVVATTFQENRVAEVVAILAPEERSDPEKIGDLLLKSPGGAAVPLREVAEIHPAQGHFVLLHDGGRRRQTVTCNVEGRDITSFVEEAKATIAREVQMPKGTYAAFSGAAEERQRGMRELWLHSGLAAVGVLLLLSMALRSGRNLALVLANLPFALVGGVIAAWLSGGSLSIGSLVGFVTLFGITTRNSLMMITHFEHLVTVEGCAWNLETALRGASERLAPIAMTALVTALGLLPLALGGGEPGREIEGPMATVILGGLITSAALNLLVLPTLALRFGRFERHAIEEEGVGSVHA